MTANHCTVVDNSRFSSHTHSHPLFITQPIFYHLSPTIPINFVLINYPINRYCLRLWTFITLSGTELPSIAAFRACRVCVSGVPFGCVGFSCRVCVSSVLFCSACQVCVSGVPVFNAYHLCLSVVHFGYA